MVEVVHTARDCAERAEVVITMLPNGKILKSVADEIIKYMKEGSIFLDCSTVDVASAKNVAEIAKNHKVIPLDAPVSGGIGGAKEGTLTFMVGGLDEGFIRAKELFDIMVQLPVLDFENILPTKLVAWYVHNQGNWSGPVSIYSEYSDYLHRVSRWDMIDHRSISNRGNPSHLRHHFTFFGTSTPRLRHRSAILVGTPLKACSKYLANSVESTLGAISSTLGSGCMMTIPFFAPARLDDSSYFFDHLNLYLVQFHPM